MINPEIEKYVLSARAMNMSDEAIRQELVLNGWQTVDIDAVLTPQMPKAPQAPAVSSKPQSPGGWWVAFRYIIFFISLYILATSLGYLFGYFIDNYLAPLPDRIGFDDMLKMAISGIIVGAPIFIFMSLHLFKDLRMNPENRFSTVRQKLIYLTLTFTFVITVYKLIFTVYQFVDGNGTLNSMFHLVSTLLLSGGIFVYFFLDLKRYRTI